MDTVYTVTRDSADGLEIDVFADESLAVEWAEAIGSTVVAENIIDRRTLDAMKETRAEAEEHEAKRLWIEGGGNLGGGA